MKSNSTWNLYNKNWKRSGKSIIKFSLFWIIVSLLYWNVHADKHTDLHTEHKYEIVQILALDWLVDKIFFFVFFEIAAHCHAYEIMLKVLMVLICNSVNHFVPVFAVETSRIAINSHRLFRLVYSIIVVNICFFLFVPFFS